MSSYVTSRIKRFFYKRSQQRKLSSSVLRLGFILIMLVSLVPVELSQGTAQATATNSSTTCPPQSVSYSFTDPPAGTITISGVKMNGAAFSSGAGTNCGTIDPGGSFSLTLTYTISDKTCGNCIHQIQVGFQNAATPAACVFDGVVGPAALTASGTVNLTAPTSPGTYYIAFDRAQANSCKYVWWSGAPPPDARRIAAITVASTNDTWPTAMPLGFPALNDNGSFSLYTDQYLWKQNGSRWYKFSAPANSKVTLTLTGVQTNNLPANFDLSFYKDIQKTYNQLKTPQDTLNLTAQAAPEAYLPEAYLPEAYLPEAYLPEAYLPEAYLPEAYLPEAYLPEAYLPEAYLPEAYLPEAYLGDYTNYPQAYFGAVFRSLLSLSARDAITPERIVRNTWNIQSSGDSFYIRVKGRNGVASSAAPFRLTVQVDTGSCGALPAIDTMPLPTAAGAGSYDSIIVTDFSRLAGTGTDLATLTSTITTFAGRPEVKGKLIDLATYPSVVSANQTAQNNLACPYGKNLVANEIKKIIDSYRPAKYVVILGPDSVVPFIRYPDQAGLANENTYWPPIQDASASQAALRNGLVLGQDGYGSTRIVNRGDQIFPLPDLAVGRLVETASEINGMLVAYLSTNGVVTPKSALVTGYDFVADDAQQVQGELQSALGVTPDNLITPQGVAPTDPRSWTADQLRQKFLNTKHDLTFLAGHFSAYGAMAADYATRVASKEVQSSVLEPNSIVFSVGCHSGYNISGSDALSGSLDEPDWAQVFARKGVTSVIGTGFQYGDTELVAFSEKLYLEFSKQLHTSATLTNGKSTVAIGQALLKAKQTYLASTTPMQGIHQKVLIEATLFGLPMLGVTLNGVTPPSDPSLVGTPATVSAGPGSALGLSTTDFNVAPSLTLKTATLTNLNDNSSVTASYYTGSNGVVSDTLDPIFPLELRNVTAANTVLRGVGLRSGTYSELANVTPLTTAPADEIGRAHPAFISSVFYPRQPWGINYNDALNGGSTRLAVMPAQYISNGPNSTTGTLRSYSSMNLRLYYSNSSGPATIALAPQISNVGITVSGNTANFNATVTGDAIAGIQEVWITYTSINPASPFYGKWDSVNLTRNVTDPTLWQGGNLALGSTNPQDLRFVVQAASGTGLVTLSTNLGGYYALNNTVPPTPTVQTTLKLQLGSIPTNLSYLDQPTIQATLSNQNGPLANQTVTFVMAGIYRQVTTDSNGVASFSPTLRVPPGTYFLTASFAGTNTLIPSSDSVQITINRRATKLTLQYSDQLGVYARLTDTSNPANPVAQRSIFFIGTNTTTNQQFGVAALTDSTGQAVLGAPGWPAGNYTVQAYFGGTVPIFGTYNDTLYSPSVSGLYSLSPKAVTVNYTGDTMIAFGATAHLSVQVNPPAGSTSTNFSLAQVTFTVKDGTGTVIATSTQILSIGGTASFNLPGLATGVYNIDVQVTGLYFNGATSAILTVYDSAVSSGMVSGGGWFISPVGAYPAGPTLSGRANFGFNSKIQSGKAAPTGQTEFNFQLGNFKFHSTGYTSLSINGAKAQYSGSGTVNGGGNYSFTVTVVDGQASGGGGTDKFAIKIWNTATSQVVYDNSTNTLGPTPIQGGNIIIKK